MHQSRQSTIINGYTARYFTGYKMVEIYQNEDNNVYGNTFMFLLENVHLQYKWAVITEVNRSAKSDSFPTLLLIG